MNTMPPTRQRAQNLRIKVIDNYTGFQAIEKAWKSLEDRDPQFTVFLSWDWLSQAFKDNPFRWSVLAAFAPDTGQLVGLLPLKYHLHWSNSRSEFQSELEAGGRLLFSEYTGFLCDPSYEAAAMQSLAMYLRVMPWSKLSLRYVAQKHRAELFCTAFERLGYPVTWKDYRINKGETDNLVCPKVALPDTFEDYLASNVSTNTRQSYRRLKRKNFADGAYYFTHCDAENFDEDLATLMRFWKDKWNAEKGEASAAKVADNFAAVLRAALASDALFLPVLWRGDTPLGALGHIVDRKAGTMHFIIAGRDPSAEETFIGAALHFHSIECAILLGYEFYDFGHGDEPYKFSYGAETTKLGYFSIRRPDAHDSNVFDTICTGVALDRIEKFIKTGKTKQARQACRQLSDTFN